MAKITDNHTIASHGVHSPLTALDTMDDIVDQ